MYNKHSYVCTYIHVHRTQSQQWCTVGGMEQEGLARGQVLSQFQQMEEQLCAIESTARMLEGELKASNKVCTYVGDMDHLLCINLAQSSSLHMFAYHVHVRNTHTLHLTRLVINHNLSCVLGIHIGPRILPSPVSCRYAHHK